MKNCKLCGGVFYKQKYNSKTCWEKRQFCSTKCATLYNLNLTQKGKERKETLRKRLTTHGMTQTPLYKRFRRLKDRCENTSHNSYPRYGGRGIKCEWNTFEEFYNDMNNSFEPTLSLDRIDNDGNYSKENCRWATSKEQSRNKSSTVSFNSFCAADAKYRLGASKNTIYERIKRGWSKEKAFNTPVKRLINCSNEQSNKKR